LPIAIAMKARGHEVRFFLRDLSAGADLEAPRKSARGRTHLVGAADLRGPSQSRRDHAQLRLSRCAQHKALVDAWRERLKGSHAVVANVAPPRTSPR